MGTTKKPEEVVEQTEDTTKNQEEVNGPKMVKIKLFKDSDKYKDDVFVGVNGHTFQIKRGVEVEVPDYVAEVLEHSQRQDESTQIKLERLQAEAAGKEELK